MANKWKDSKKKHFYNTESGVQGLMLDAIGFATNKLQYLLERNTTRYGAVKTGFLRDSWEAEVVRTEKGNIVMRCYTDAPYAVYVEKGHRTKLGGWVKARPIARDSVLELREQIIPRMSEEIGRVLGRMIFAMGRGGHGGYDRKGYMAIDWWNGQREPDLKQLLWSLT